MAGVVHEFGDAAAGHVFGRIGTQQGFQELRFEAVWLQPPLIMFGADDHRHPIVDGGDHRIGFGGDDGKSLDGLINARAGVIEAELAFAVRSMPFLPEAGHAEEAAILAGEAEWLLAGGRGLPFVKAIGGNQAALLFEGPAETGFVGDSFGAGVGQLVADGFVLGPGGDQAPAHGFQGGNAALPDQNWRLGAGGEVVARLEIHDLADEPDESSDLRQILGDGVAAAHGGNLNLKPEKKKPEIFPTDGGGNNGVVFYLQRSFFALEKTIYGWQQPKSESVIATLKPTMKTTTRLIPAQINRFLIFPLLGMYLLLTGCSTYHTKTVSQTWKPAMAKTMPDSSRLTIEVVIGMRPDYFTQMKSQGLDGDFIKAAASLQHSIAGGDASFWDSYWQSVYNGRITYETKRSITDFYYAMELIHALKNRFTNAVIYLRPTDQSGLFSVARDFNYLKSHVGHALDFDWSPMPEWPTAYQANLDRILVIKDLLGYPQMTALDSNSPATITIDFRTVPGMEISERNYSTYGHVIACMAQAYGQNETPFWVSLDAHEVAAGKRNFFGKKRYQAGLEQNPDIGDWLQKYFTNAPAKAEWSTYEQSLKPYLDTDLSDIPRCGAYVNNFETNQFSYVFDRFAYDISQAWQTNDLKANIGRRFQTWAQFYDTNYHGSFNLLEPENLTPKTRERSLASILKAELQLMTKLTDIMEADQYQKGLGETYRGMTQEECKLADADQHAQNMALLVGILGVAAQGMALQGQIAAQNAGNMTAARSFQQMNFQTMTTTMNQMQAIDRSRNELNARSTEFNQVMAEKIGPIRIEIDGQFYELKADSLANLRVQMQIKYVTRYPDAGRAMEIASIPEIANRMDARADNTSAKGISQPMEPSTNQVGNSFQDDKFGRLAGNYTGLTASAIRSQTDKSRLAAADGSITIKKTSSGSYQISGSVNAAGLPAVNHLVDSRAWVKYRFDCPLEEVSPAELATVYPNENRPAEIAAVAFAKCEASARNDINSGNPFRIDKVIIVKTSKGELLVRGVNSPDCRSSALALEFGSYGGFEYLPR